MGAMVREKRIIISGIRRKIFFIGILKIVRLLYCYIVLLLNYFL